MLTNIPKRVKRASGVTCSYSQPAEVEKRIQQCRGQGHVEVSVRGQTRDPSETTEMARSSVNTSSRVGGDSNKYRIKITWKTLEVVHNNEFFSFFSHSYKCAISVEPIHLNQFFLRTYFSFPCLLL